MSFFCCQNIRTNRNETQTQVHSTDPKQPKLTGGVGATLALSYPSDHKSVPSLSATVSVPPTNTDKHSATDRKIQQDTTATVPLMTNGSGCGRRNGRETNAYQPRARETRITSDGLSNYGVKRRFLQFVQMIAFRKPCCGTHTNTR